jgi:hypothetical protein
MAIRNDLFHQQSQERRQSTTSIVSASSVAASDLDDSVPSTHDVGDMDELGLYDVICGRHKEAFNNIGNRRFRVTISLAQDRYTGATTRKEKSVVIKSLADMVRANGGRFLQRQDDAWVELSEKQAHEKVGHALRDMAVSSAMKLEVLGTHAPKSSTKPGGAGGRPLATKLAGRPSKLLSKVCCNTLSAVRQVDQSQRTVSPTIEESTDDISIDPIPWVPADEEQQEPDLDHSILSWLSKESDSILYNCNFES